MPHELLKICESWAKEIEALSTVEDRIQFFRKHLPALLLNTPLFAEILKRMIRGKPYPDIRKTEMFDNEILLYLHPKRLFSLRLFLFGPKEFTPIHDHNSWGVTGTAFNRLTIVRYKREDDGSQEDFARIVETQRLTMEPGDTSVTLPLDEGIHATGNATQEPMMMVSIYGNPIRRLYVNRFDPEKNRVFKLFTPRIRKRIKAEKTLSSIEKNRVIGGDGTEADIE